VAGVAYLHRHIHPGFGQHVLEYAASVDQDLVCYVWGQGAGKGRGADFALFIGSIRVIPIMIVLSIRLFLDKQRITTKVSQRKGISCNENKLVSSTSLTTAREKRRVHL
jgi:hypothetical protein